jgi:hypothetical protein
MATTLDRRSFIAAGGGLLSLTALDRLAAQDALARHSRRDEPYGPLRRMPDQRGVEVLALPAGFSYVTFSHTGSTMSDGNPTPLALDGMAAFPGRRPGEVRLIRNSEDRNPFGVPGSVLGERGQVRPRRRWRHDDARVRRAPARTRRRLDLAERHDRQLRRRHRPRQAELAHVRGDGRGPGGDGAGRAVPAAPRLHV